MPEVELLLSFLNEEILRESVINYLISQSQLLHLLLLAIDILSVLHHLNYRILINDVMISCLILLFKFALVSFIVAIISGIVHFRETLLITFSTLLMISFTWRNLAWLFVQTRKLTLIVD